MAKKIVIIYDDSIIPSYDISNIIGEKSFGQIVHKRQSLKEKYFNYLKKVSCISSIYECPPIYEWKKIMKFVEELPKGVGIAHVFSDYFIKKEDIFFTTAEKMQYMKSITKVCDKDGEAMIIFPEREEYLEFLKEAYNTKATRNASKDWSTCDILFSEAYIYMNRLSNFLQYITGGFDARFFNSLSGDDYIVTKKSTNKKKIKMEYTFYHLLPDEMKVWFVLPYDYKETEEYASYTMERLHMTDIAIRWVHGAIGIEEFKKLLDKIFYFIQMRKKKKISKEEYQKKAENLYLYKVKERIEELKKHPMYEIFHTYIKTSTPYKDIDEIVKSYQNIYQNYYSSMIENGYIDVIGHGDLCFSNILYNKDTATLKLIDTKGALEEKDIWTNPYYDLAKLSHSICGKYDFFNNGLYEIRLNDKCEMELSVDYDNTAYKELFKEKLEENGYQYKTVRVLEVSLFLSMLPLHMDNPQKVFGFILNAIQILGELEDE